MWRKGDKLEQEEKKEAAAEHEVKEVRRGEHE